ncbi:Uncharacterised protein [Zhongshania aliphaticivorans]|uniref:DUF3261 domain-containing protein n=1 Tax=Zhongshania aliphaticivorans TaxID=1470434 RepID=A0A5S9NMS0_9GAMM|nr:DUF3261 domain-containing protein [Zhongshania aliphaticivorans]CAA0091626.1 Uncharacterised protein [Zhongshania aliphaticivorans]CAA0098971.1 Uncharacterised protein [Zhongshania aliphaticivorans]
MSRLVILLCLALLQACASQDQRALYHLDTPSFTTLNCCWQSLETIRISGSEQSIELLSALELLNDHLTVVILDPLGHNLATFRQDQAGLHTLNAPPDWDTRLSKHILLAIYLDQLQASDWHSLAPEWTVIIKENSRTLRYNDSVKLTIKYVQNDSNNRQRHIYIDGQPLTLEIKTLSRTVL